MGYGRQLLGFAMGKQDPRKSVFVQTFDESSREGKAARTLYGDFGFEDHKNGGVNPAGLRTLIMRLAKAEPVGA